MDPDVFAHRVMAAATSEEDAARGQLRYAENNVDVIVGETVADLGYTRLMLGQTAPAEWERVAAYLVALISREPMRNGPAFGAHRIILGSLASELRRYARSAGEPIGLEVDLRGASTKAEQRRITARMEANREMLRAWMEDNAHGPSARLDAGN